MFDTRFYPYPDNRYLWGQDVDEEIKSQHPRYKYVNYICFSCKHKADDNPYCECCEHYNKYEGSIIRTEECLNMNYKGSPQKSAAPEECILSTIRHPHGSRRSNGKQKSNQASSWQEQSQTALPKPELMRAASNTLRSSTRGLKSSSLSTWTIR